MKFNVLLLLLFLSTCSEQEAPHSAIQTVPISDKKEVNSDKTSTTPLLKFETGIRAILEDGKGNIWFASHQEGVCLFDGKEMTYFTTEDGLSHNQVRSIYQDINGQVWFEGGEGISYYDGKNIKTPSSKNYFSKNNWQSKLGDIWFKSDKGNGYNKLEGQPGVYRYDGTTLSYHTFPVVPKAGEEFYYSISTPFCNGKNGMVWFGAYGTVVGYNGQNFTILDNERLGLNEETGFLHVRSIFEDSQGNLWIGNNGIGVLKYDGFSTINFSKSQGLVLGEKVQLGAFPSSSRSLERIFSIGEDKNGNMWFGDRDTGAWKYNGTTMTNYGKKEGLSVTHIWQIYNAKNGELWFAMGDGTVSKFNGTSFERIF